MDSNSSSFHHSSYNCSSPDSESNSNQDLLNASALEEQIRQSNNQIGTVILYGVPIVSLMMETKERLCLAQISSTLLKDYSYNEIHNRRVALGITCAQCTPVQLELLRRAGAMPVTSRRCGMITRREAERLCKSFLGDHSPPKLPDNFAFDVSHCCAWGCRGAFLPSRYNSSRAKCIKCFYCSLFFSPNKFIFHSHRSLPDAKYIQPDAANFNSWRRHIHLTGSPPDQVMFAWEDVKAMFNGGSRKRVASGGGNNSGTAVTSTSNQNASGTEINAKQSQEIAVPAKNTKTTKNSACANKRPKVENNSLPEIRTAEIVAAVTTTISSTSSSPGPIAAPVTPQVYQHHPIQSQSLLARLNSIIPTAGPLLANKTPTDSPAQDYSMTMWNAAGTGRFWSPYLNPLPFNPYSYYNYLINKSDQFSLMMNHSGSGWQQLVTNKPRISSANTSAASNPVLKAGLEESKASHTQMNHSLIEEDEAEAFVDVESTDPALDN
ncbi:SKI family transcriptional corepressor 1 [Daphnia magna]|uniref:c-SKI SMAD4-binding domain-containing protein n=1 Tax=Daphnia magna TaxID=35525 RepID=A0ABQ9ZRZ4_9CRUS|nr:SKI family transcriptional corepressor 1 [Daphnia magna]KAK4015533.1 hypothetical protein OUZ56_030509 [Daphnia magna]